MFLRALRGLELEGSELKRPKPLLLLTYLTLEGPQTRRHLGELFWLGAANPLGSLSMALTQLRKAAPGAIAANESHVESQVRCDAHEVLSAVDARDFERALELYRGPFLEGIHLRGWGVELEEWVLATRELLAGRIRKLLLERAGREAASSLFRDAARLAEQALSLSGAPPLEVDEIEMVLLLLKSGDTPIPTGLREEALEYGLNLDVVKDAARQKLTGAGLSTAVGSGLPKARTTFVGRERELTEVAAHLADPACPLLTLLGPPGVGKTRLASQAAVEQVRLGTFPGGVHLVPLESLSSPDSLVAAIGDALELGSNDSDQPLSQIAQRLNDAAALLILDNFEHMVEGAGTVSALVQACPELTLLVTSRERLNLEEERVFPVTGLSVPADDITEPNDALQSDALRLFIARARRSDPAFGLTEANLAPVLRICRLVEGLPLGLELAATWARVLQPWEIAAELERNLDLLATPLRNVSERHRSLRGAFEHSWNLLNLSEQRVLSRLSVFRGGFRREAAAYVAGANISILRSLVDRSLLRVDGLGRYDRHPLLHHFTAEKLRKDPEGAHEARSRHASYYAGFLTSLAKGAVDEGTLASLDSELENFKLAVEWLIESGEPATLVQVSEALRFYFDMRKRYSEGALLLGRMVQHLPEATEMSRARGVAARDQAWLIHQSGRHELATEIATEALQHLLVDAQPVQVAKCYNVLGSAAWSSGRHRDAYDNFRTALGMARSYENESHVATYAANLAMVAQSLGDFPEALEKLELSLEAFRRLKDDFHVIRTLNKLGVLHMDMGDLQPAEACYAEARLTALESGMEDELPRVVVNLGVVAFERHDYGAARRLTESALRSLKDGDDRFLRAYAHARLGRIEAVTGEIAAAERRLLSALEVGAGMLAIKIEVASGYVDLLLQQGRTQDAVALLSMLVAHPSLEFADRERYSRRLDAACGRRPGVTAANDVRLREGLTLEGAVDRLLAEAAN